MPRRASSLGSHNTSTALDGTEFAALIEALAPAHHLAMAVSGGPDSMAMAALSVDWARRTGRRVTLLIVDHGLRPESRQQARSAWRYAHEILGTTGVILGGPVATQGSASQHAARSRRMALLTGFCRAHGIRDIIFAHHREDQAETFVLRLARGSGLDGLSAMAHIQSWHDGLRLLRPCLDVPGLRLRRAGRWAIQDPSNENTHYSRVRIRLGREQLSSFGLSTDRLAAVAAMLRSDQRCLKAQLRKAASYLSQYDALAGLVWLDPAPLVETMAIRLLRFALATLCGRHFPARSPGLLRILRWREAADSARHAPSTAPIQPARTLAGCVIRLLWSDTDHRHTLLLLREPSANPVPARAWHGARRLSWDGRLCWYPAPWAGRIGLRIDVLGRATPDNSNIAVLGRATPDNSNITGLPASARAMLPVILDRSGCVVHVPCTGWTRSGYWYPGPIVPVHSNLL